jgi:hypothetical protein
LAFQAITKFGNLKPLFHHRLILQKVRVPNPDVFCFRFPRLSTRLNLLHEYAHYVEGTGQKSVSVEAGLMDMLQRMESGRFKVFKEHHDWWEEFRLFHRKDGKVVKEGDDLMCATRYALMMLRHASTAQTYRNFRRKLVYPRAGVI